MASVITGTHLFVDGAPNKGVQILEPPRPAPRSVGAAVPRWSRGPGIAGFSLATALEIEPGFFGIDHHQHDDAVQSFVFTSTAAFDGDRLQSFFRNAIAQHAQDLMRPW